MKVSLFFSFCLNMFIQDSSANILTSLNHGNLKSQHLTHKMSKASMEKQLPLLKIGFEDRTGEAAKKSEVYFEMGHSIHIFNFQ